MTDADTIWLPQGDTPASWAAQDPSVADWDAQNPIVAQWSLLVGGAPSAPSDIPSQSFTLPTDINLFNAQLPGISLTETLIIGAMVTKATGKFVGMSMIFTDMSLGIFFVTSATPGSVPLGTINVTKDQTSEVVAYIPTGNEGIGSAAGIANFVKASGSFDPSIAIQGIQSLQYGVFGVTYPDDMSGSELEIWPFSIVRVFNDADPTPTEAWNGVNGAQPIYIRFP